jgi:hypothetical protein
MNPKAMWQSLPRGARIYLSAVGALAVAGLATVVTVAATGAPLLAASPSPSPSPTSGTNYCGSFTGHLGSNLGKSPSQVQKAISDAVNQTVDDAVKNGDLTQSQANAIKARIASKAGNQACGGLGGLPHVGRGGPGFAGPGFFGPGLGAGHGRAAGLDEYAKALGISQAELQQDIRNGQTVKDVAASKGLDEAAFRGKLAGVTKTDLDARVKAGNLTQKQEDAILQGIQNGPLPLWDRVIRSPKAPAATPTPTPSPTATP